MAGLCAGSERIVDDGFYRRRTAAALNAAAQAIIDMLCVPKHLVSGIDSIADIAVAENVAGANDHETRKTFVDTRSILR